MSAGRGRPTKLDDIRAKKIVDAIKAGCSRRAAANKAGLARDTLENWIARGRRGDPGFVDFFDRVTCADGEAEEAFTGRLKDASDKGDVRATIFWLQQRRREEWGATATNANDAKPEAVADAEHDVELIASLYAATQSRAAK